MADNNNIPHFVNSESFMADKNYVKWLSDLKKRIRIAQLKAAVRVNEESSNSTGAWERISVRSKNNIIGELLLWIDLVLI